MKEIISEKRATEMVQETIGEVLVQAAYAKNAPPGTTVVIAGETFVVAIVIEAMGRGPRRRTQNRPVAWVVCSAYGQRNS